MDGQPAAGACTGCDENGYCANTGSCDVSQTLCSSNLPQGCVCNAGFTSDGAEGCQACAAGTYKAGSGNEACTDCGAGKYSNASGATAESTCSACTSDSDAPANYARACGSQGTPLPCFRFCVLGHRILLSSLSLCSRRWRCRFGKSDSGSFRWTCGERVVDGRSSEAASDRVCDNLQQNRCICKQVNRCRNQGWGCKRIQWKHGMRNNLYSRCRNKQKD